jgi:hypothetical protein
VAKVVEPVNSEKVAAPSASTGPVDTDRNVVDHFIADHKWPLMAVFCIDLFPPTRVLRRNYVLSNLQLSSRNRKDFENWHVYKCIVFGNLTHNVLEHFQWIQRSALFL